MALFSKSIPAHSLAVMSVLRKINTVELQNNYSYRASWYMDPFPPIKSLEGFIQSITSSLTLSWRPLPCLPVQALTASTLCGQLVPVGGSQHRLFKFFRLHFPAISWRWRFASWLVVYRYCCLVASAPPDKIIIVGS